MNITNTDEIVCPYCKHKHEDSYDYLPDEDRGNELSFEMDCNECNKEFHVSFDTRNINDGYTSKRKECFDDKHEWEAGTRGFAGSLGATNVYTCKHCNKYKFIPLKEDGTEFTDAEIRKEKNRADKERRRSDPFWAADYPHPSPKEKKISMYVYDTKMVISSTEPAGNRQSFRKLMSLMVSYGFILQYNKFLPKGHNSLRPSHKYGTHNNKMEFNAEYHNNCIDKEYP